MNKLDPTLPKLRKGWTVQGKTASFNGGRKEEFYSCGKKVGEEWSYRATVTLSANGLTVSVENDDDRSGMAHGGSHAGITIPLDIFGQLQAN